MTNGKIILTAGFAMFCMFFGAGNLVFPLVTGTQNLDNAFYAMLGLGVTGVLVPFLGLIGVILYSGNRNEFFSCIGKIPAFLLIFVMIALLGPVGVVPRCIVVAHGAMHALFPQFSLWTFSLAFCLISFILIWKHDKVVPIIGRYLTPCLLIGITTICVAGTFFSDAAIQNSDFSFSEAFKNGLIDGYQTMDLLAAFFFSTATVVYIKNNLSSENNTKLLKIGLAASLIGAGFIAIIYIGFVLLGAKHAPHLLAIRPEQMLSTVATHTLGPIATPIVAFTVLLACLTTAAVLSLLFAEFLNNDVCRNKLGNQKAIIFTLTLSFAVSLVGFDSLRIWLGTILQVAYPALIVLTLINIINKLWNIPSHHFGRWGFWLTMAASSYYYCVVV